ncbi:hypothetical protein EVAR_29697_1 [Eumeta japonica]|uniref:Uncharacterized protein n=1 Tax=Eumeta variegata TaxID=151549 RepID=A0A4C1VWT1_EUMVA|nr:hypothetical protein EVAR_29697_1 [Eumeta japonica]
MKSGEVHCSLWLRSRRPMNLKDINNGFVMHQYSSVEKCFRTTLQDTEQPSPQLTPARRSSKWDAAERHQSSRRPPHESGCQDPGRSS